MDAGCCAGCGCLPGPGETFLLNGHRWAWCCVLGFAFQAGGVPKELLRVSQRRSQGAMKFISRRQPGAPGICSVVFYTARRAGFFCSWCREMGSPRTRNSLDALPSENKYSGLACRFIRRVNDKLHAYGFLLLDCMQAGFTLFKDGAFYCAFFDVRPILVDENSASHYF